MLAKQRPFAPGPEVKECLIRWYGGQGGSVEHAEAFEICEYGKQPDEKEIRRLFPMLK